MCVRPVGPPLDTPCGREGSEGSKGSKGSKGSEGGCIAFGHACGVRVDGSLSRRFLGFLGLTATTWLRVVVAALDTPAA